MESTANKNLIGTIGRHWYWGLAALLLAVLMIAASGESAAPALADHAACSGMAGDINDDCAVSGLDMFILLVHYGDTGESVPGSGTFICSTPIPGDLTNDCAVAGNDLFALLRNFGKVA